jgi:hypothetical protein
MYLCSSHIISTSGVHEILGHETNLQDRSGDQAKNCLEDELEAPGDFFVQEASVFCLAPKQEIHHGRRTHLRSRSGGPFDWYFPFIHSTSKGYALIAASDQRPNQSISSTILPFHATNSKPSSYIEDGYSITLTDAPKDLGGRLFLNCARTTPELPRKSEPPTFKSSSI